MDKEKDVLQTVKEEPKTVSLSVEEYRNLISESAKYKAQVELMSAKPAQKEVVLEIEQSHVNPQTDKPKRGFFN